MLKSKDILVWKVEDYIKYKDSGDELKLKIAKINLKKKSKDFVEELKKEAINYESKIKIINWEQVNYTLINDYSDCFVFKLSSNGSSLMYSTYIGGSANDIGYSIAIDDSGDT